jgi:hypothetical protein
MVPSAARSGQCEAGVARWTILDYISCARLLILASIAEEGPIFKENRPWTYFVLKDPFDSPAVLG